jgi:hypothetical protein
MSRGASSSEELGEPPCEPVAAATALSTASSIAGLSVASLTIALTSALLALLATIAGLLLTITTLLLLLLAVATLLLTVACTTLARIAISSVAVLVTTILATSIRSRSRAGIGVDSRSDERCIELLASCTLKTCNQTHQIWPLRHHPRPPHQLPGSQLRRPQSPSGSGGSGLERP